jgi:hypothetical protein
MKWFRNKTLVTVVISLIILALILAYIPLLFV